MLKKLLFYLGDEVIPTLTKNILGSQSILEVLIEFIFHTNMGKRLSEEDLEVLYTKLENGDREHTPANWVVDMLLARVAGEIPDKEL